MNSKTLIQFKLFYSIYKNSIYRLCPNVASFPTRILRWLGLEIVVTGLPPCLNSIQKVSVSYLNQSSFPLCQKFPAWTTYSIVYKIMIFWRAFIIVKGVMQGKLIAVMYTLRTHWNQFSLGGICKQKKVHQCSFSIRAG